MAFKCPFASPIATRQAACRHAREVVRRGGSEYDCADAAAHGRCAAMYERLKTVGLAAFAVEDDLTAMPHSTLVKIQAGGLLGLKDLVAGSSNLATAGESQVSDKIDGPSAAEIADIDALIDEVARRYGDLAAVPVEHLGDAMTRYVLPRRGRRRR